MTRSNITIVLFTAILTLWASTASAALLAGLQVDIGSGVDANVRTAIAERVSQGARSGSYWQWVETNTARSQMNPVVRDCFTADCLQKAGKATGADAGLRVRFTGEAEIYDWTLEIYDLRSGKQLESKKGSCELCGQAEVVREFENSVQSIVASTRLPRRKPAPTTTNTPPPTTDDETAEPPKTVAEPEESAPSDPLGDLSVVEITTYPEDTIIFLAGEEIGRGTTSISLEPGTYEFRFAREGYKGFKETLVVDPATTKRAFMRVHLSQTDPMPVPVAGASGPIDRLGNQRKTYGIIGLATGGALLGTGIYLNYLDGRPACDGGEFTECARLYETSTLSFLTTFTGAALITGGAALLAWEALAGAPADEKTARIAPIAMPSGGGVAIFGRF